MQEKQGQRGRNIKFLKTIKGSKTRHQYMGDEDIEASIYGGRRHY
jgi:hypothetical protein